MDLSLLASANRGIARPAAGDALRGAAGASRIALTLQALLQVVEAQGAHTPFARDVRALVADAVRGAGTVVVVQPAGAGALRIEIGRQFLTVPPTLRDAVLALVEQQRGATGAAGVSTAPPSPAVAPSSMPTAALAAGAVAWAQSWVMSAQAGAAAGLTAPRAVRPAAGNTNGSRAPVASVDADVMLFDGPGTGAASAAARLRSAVDLSGLFFESHLAQWSAGTRSAEDIAGELARLQRRLPSAQADDHPELRTLAAAAPSGERVAAQLDVLQKSAFALNMMAWPGQPCTIEVREEDLPERRTAGAPEDTVAAMFVATIALDLPRLGPVEVQLRLSGSSVAVTADAQPRSRARLAAGIADLGEALRARGLNPAALQLRQGA